MTEKRAEHRTYEADYYAEAQQRNQSGTRHFGAEDQPDARAGAQAKTQEDASQYSVNQGQQLLEGQTTRGDAPVPEDNYPNKSHGELYGMVHSNLDLDGINNRGRVANEVGNWLADISNQFSDAVSASGSEWQGGAADQARSFFQATSDHAAQTGQAVQLSSNHYSQQAAAAHYAKTNMPEPTGFDQNAEMAKAQQQWKSGDLINAVSTMDGIQAKQQQADAAHAQAVQVMQNLDSTYHGTATSQPTYSPPPMPGSDNTSVSGFHGTSGYGGGGGVSYPGGGPGGGGPGGSSFVSPGGSPAPVTPGPQPPPSGYVPPGVSSGAGNFNSPGNPGFRPPVTPSTMPRTDGLALSGGPGGTAGGTSGGDTTRRPGGGRPGSGFAGSRVSGGGYTPKTPEGEGGGKGSGAGKPAGERLERGATAAANAKGKAGAAGAAGAGAGKKKEEDKEHKNKIPIQEEVFEMRAERGPDGEKITPPVIGG